MAFNVRLQGKCNFCFVLRKCAIYNTVFLVFSTQCDLKIQKQKRLLELAKLYILTRSFGNIFCFHSLEWRVQVPLLYLKCVPIYQIVVFSMNFLFFELEKLCNNVIVMGRLRISNKLRWGNAYNNRGTIYKE